MVNERAARILEAVRRRAGLLDALLTEVIEECDVLGPWSEQMPSAHFSRHGLDGAEVAAVSVDRSGAWGYDWQWGERGGGSGPTAYSTVEEAMGACDRDLREAGLTLLEWRSL